jgi:hypothetical protein
MQKDAIPLKTNKTTSAIAYIVLFYSKTKISDLSFKIQIFWMINWNKSDSQFA